MVIIVHRSPDTGPSITGRVSHVAVISEWKRRSGWWWTKRSPLSQNWLRCKVRSLLQTPGGVQSQMKHLVRSSKNEEKQGKKTWEKEVFREVMDKIEIKQNQINSIALLQEMVTIASLSCVGRRALPEESKLTIRKMWRLSHGMLAVVEIFQSWGWLSREFRTPGQYRAGKI